MFDDILGLLGMGGELDPSKISTTLTSGGGTGDGGGAGDAPDPAQMPKTLQGYQQTAQARSDATPNDAKLGQLQLFFADRLQDMQQDRELQGQPGFSINSGYRDTNQQAKLYAEKPGLAAPPGHSNHEFGAAADIQFAPGARDDIHALASQYGMRFPMGYEPWHIEPNEAAGGALRTAAFTPGSPSASITPTPSSTVSLPAVSAVTRQPLSYGGTTLTSTPSVATAPTTTPDPNAPANPNNVKDASGKTPGEQKLEGLAGLLKGVQGNTAKQQAQTAAPAPQMGTGAGGADGSRYSAAAQLMQQLLTANQHRRAV